MSEFTIAKILKHLALILEENGFILYYDKRFPSMKPHINDTAPYLYHNSLGQCINPVYSSDSMIKTSKLIMPFVMIKTSQGL